MNCIKKFKISLIITDDEKIEKRFLKGHVNKNLGSNYQKPTAIKKTRKYDMLPMAQVEIDYNESSYFEFTVRVTLKSVSLCFPIFSICRKCASFVFLYCNDHISYTEK